MDTSIALAVTVLVRLLVPLSIFKWRIAGVLLAALADALDVVLVDVLAVLLGETSGFGVHYQFFDKWLDMYYPYVRSHRFSLVGVCARQKHQHSFILLPAHWTHTF